MKINGIMQVFITSHCLSNSVIPRCLHRMLIFVSRLHTFNILTNMETKCTKHNSQVKYSVNTFPTANLSQHLWTGFYLISLGLIKQHAQVYRPWPGHHLSLAIKKHDKTQKKIINLTHLYQNSCFMLTLWRTETFGNKPSKVFSRH